MILRDRIKKDLADGFAGGDYQKLKDCLILKDPYTNINRIDDWFRGMIESLYYKPNNFVLVLEGENEIGKTEFFESLMYEGQMLYSCPVAPKEYQFIYSSMICNINFDKTILNLPMEDNFIVYEDNLNSLVEPSCDKRLASYCCTTEKWVYPQRKTVIVLELDCIDLVSYMAINRLDLWREIFLMFKPK